MEGVVQSPSILGDHLIMTRALYSARPDVIEREKLRKRVTQFYLRFNKADWEGCYALIDPQLTQNGKVKPATYSGSMQAFKDTYGSVKRWLTRLSLHLDPTPKQRDKRPFAYVYVIWQDEGQGFHVFRERWIKND